MLRTSLLAVALLLPAVAAHADGGVRSVGPFKEGMKVTYQSAHGRGPFALARGVVKSIDEHGNATLVGQVPTKLGPRARVLQTTEFTEVWNKTLMERPPSVARIWPDYWASHPEPAAK